MKRCAWLPLLLIAIFGDVALRGQETSEPSSPKTPPVETSAPAQGVPAKPSAEASPDEPAIEHRYQLKLNSQMQLKAGKTINHLSADTIFDYSWRTRADTAELLLYALGVRVIQDGKLLMKTTMSRAGGRFQEGDDIEEIPIAKANDDFKKVLSDTFAVPLCRNKLDAEGNVIDQTMLAGPGAKSTLENGLLANARLFHPPFSPDKESWQAAAAIPMAGGLLAQGLLTYQRQAADKDELMNERRVLVSGKLTGGGKSDERGSEMRNAVYNLTGSQTYDPSLRVWISGELKAEISFDVYSQDQQVGGGSGIMTLKLQRAASPKGREY